jgi:DNA-binding beta-propeller fold protein YncE
MARWALILFAVAVVVACGGSGGGAPRLPAGDGGTPPGERTSWAGEEPAPELPAGLSWFNVEQPLTIAGLRGKVILLDFWTQGCINCQHIIPDLERLEEEFGDALVVIGVHSGKYSTEHEDETVREAIDRLGIHHPVVNDPDFAAWQAFGARAWPTLFLIDPAGKVVGLHAGEGVYDLFQPIVGSLIDEFEQLGAIDRTPLPLAAGASALATAFRYPGKVLADERSGRLYVADSGHHRVVVLSLQGVVEAVIGDGEAGFADGAAAEARFRQPQGLALSADGETLYVADTRNHAVRAVDLPTGRVTTIAGTGRQLDRLPGAGAKAVDTDLASPWDLVAVGGTLFITMAGVHQVWAVNLDTNAIEVFAGTGREGIDDGPRRSIATLAQPSGIVSDGAYLYWVDPESSSVRQVALGEDEMDVRTLVGTGLFDYGDRDGVGRGAQLQHPQGIAVAGGRLFLADTFNHRLKALDLSSTRVTTLAGNGERGRDDGTGAEATFDEPGGLTYAGGRLFVADTNNHAVRVVDATTGEVSTLSLSRLEVLQPGGDRTRVVLSPATVSAGAGTLRLTIAAPDAYHLNSGAPGRLTLAAGDERVAALSESELSWTSDAARVELPIPADFAPGQTTLTASGEVYYCREGDEALCFIHLVELVLPLTVEPGSPNGEAAFTYSLPEGP